MMRQRDKQKANARCSQAASPCKFCQGAMETSESGRHRMREDIICTYLIICCRSRSVHGSPGSPSGVVVQLSIMR